MFDGIVNSVDVLIFIGLFYIAWSKGQDWEEREQR